jgi:6-pyruvoyl-tetrahydropterin synthase
MELKSNVSTPFFGYKESIDVLINMLGYTGRADVIISSFAISDYFICRLSELRNRIKHLTVILDFSVLNNSSLFMFLENIADKVFFTNNHSKVILCRSYRSAVSVMSCNATHNDKNEAGIITTEPNLVNFFSDKITKVIKEAAEWN